MHPEGSALKKILVIDDEPDIQVILRMTLEMLGRFEVEVCSSGPEALERGIRFQPQLVLLDVMMPKMDGPATLAAMRQLPVLAGVPVILVTAKAMDQEIASYYQLGVIGIIVKPFDPTTLSQQVCKLWRDHQL